MALKNKQSPQSVFVVLVFFLICFSGLNWKITNGKHGKHSCQLRSGFFKEIMTESTDC